MRLWWWKFWRGKRPSDLLFRALLFLDLGEWARDFARWEYKRVDRSRFAHKCSKCGELTADPPSTFFVDLPGGGRELARHESECMSCMLGLEEL